LFDLKYFYYFCSQEVEEEAGSAGEQPVSNKLPALHGNSFLLEGRHARMHVVLPVILLPVSLYG
jgi:hypothetical protein